MAQLCLNPEFETNLTGWFSNEGSSPVLTRDTTEFRSGVASMKIVSDASSTYEYAYYPATGLGGRIHVGDIIVARGWLKGASGIVGIGAFSYSSTDTSVPDDFIEPGDVKTLNGTWQFCEFRYTHAKSTTSRVDLLVGMMDNAGGAQALTFFTDSLDLIVYDPADVPAMGVGGRGAGW